MWNQVDSYLNRFAGEEIDSDDEASETAGTAFALAAVRCWRECHGTSIIP